MQANVTEIPVVKGYPVVGLLPGFWREPFATLVGAVREVGDIAWLDLPGQKWILVSHPDHVEHVLKTNVSNYIKGYDKARVLQGNGLVLNEGSSWLRQRRLMQPAFHRRYLEHFAATMVEETEKVLRDWEEPASAGRAIDVAKEMKLLTQRIIVKTMFGSEVGAEGERISWAFDVAMRGIELRIQLPLWTSRLPLPVNRRFEQALAILDGAVYRMIRARRREEAGREDLLSMLLSARDEETGEAMTQRQVRDEVMGIYLAGHETTALTLTWLWYLLSTSPDATRKVRAEALEVTGDRSPEVGDLPNLTYTRMVVDETLRLYPPAWILARKAIDEDEIHGYRIPAGSGLLVCPYVTHRRTDLWENPEGFDPERFAPGTSGGRPRYTYFPFGGGPRQCIGNNFALMEATLVVATIARRYRLDLMPGQEIEPKASGTLKPGSPVWMVPHAVAGSAVAR